MTDPSHNEEGQDVTSPESEGVDETVAADETAVVENTEEAVADEAAVAEDVEDFAADDFVADESFAVETPAVLIDRPIQTVGRRKEAVVRVRLVAGSGKFTLNGKPLETYFPNKLHQQLIREPLVTVEKTERFDIFANLHGGGISGQAGALRLAIARALVEADSEDRPPLKRAGFLTRDARVTERKKYGLKKARKAPQYSKR
ncbi:ribosomal protein S9 [Pseudonocardia dioxanivorans CB1190]|uniref:Small ribosomal subunit protein uS9 n=1 Tax=Pseudonocardia dioxanivorans (strain ATCC 55486 / DSM 44775 / JCM 13855 / CB1190) TaxID=675635 RepID=F4CW92_PSEUX|nr:ribosomal protein S9 [Pseudonocardia dioxanivorans CB1190]